MAPNPNDTKSYEDQLAERERISAEYLRREIDLTDRAGAERAERSAWWEDLVTKNRRESFGAQLSSYQSIAKSMATLLGASISEQAKVMVPFEIAEATKEFARFLGSGDPAALASSLRHTLAARQYAAAAKSGGGGGSGGAGGGGGEKRRAEPAAPDRKQARVVVNVGRQVGLVDTYEFARSLIESINENLSDDVILEVGP